MAKYLKVPDRIPSKWITLLSSFSAAAMERVAA